MDVFLMVRRQKTTIFLDAKEDTSLYELKRIIQGITGVAPEDQNLYYKNEILDDSKHLNDYGLNGTSAKAQSPATIGLAYSSDDGLEITPLSTPPDLPDVMKTPESAGAAQHATQTEHS